MKTELAKESDMNCPVCKTKMIGGSAAIYGGSLIGFFFFGFSREHLWFQNGKGNELVVKSKRRTQAWRCSPCGTLVLPDADRIIDNAHRHIKNGELDCARKLYQDAVDYDELSPNIVILVVILSLTVENAA